MKFSARAARNIRWIEEHCHVPDGKSVGRKIKLTEHQKLWIEKIYGSPTRTFICSIPRKNSKTTFCAFIVLLHLAGPESVKNGQLFSAAQSRDQAAILFSLAAKIIRMSPVLSQYVVIRDTAKQLHCSELGTLYRALSAESSTAYGLSPSLVIHDELGQTKGPRSELFEALETASGAQQDPLSIIISTQAPTDSDLLSVLIDDALSGADPRTKVVLYSAPLDADPFDESTIEACNPNYSIMNKDEVRRQADEAKRLPSREAAYRNLILNQRVEAKNPLIPRKLWEDNAGMPAEDFEGIEVYGGLDLSSVSDLTALVLISKVGIVGEKWHVKPTFWLPSEGLEQKSRTDRVSYDLWAQQGYLETTPGRAIEYEFVADYLRKLFDRCDVKAIAFDRYNMRFLKPWLVEAGFSESELERFVEFGQGYASMSPAIRELESMLLANKLEHGMHPVLTMCAANATVVSDPAGNRKFTKMKATGRIDGMVALTMAIGATLEATQDAQPGIVIL